MEELIKQKLINRGFKKETLLNNRGLIGACIEETEQQLRLHGVGSTLTYKEKIDYEIYAKRIASEENTRGWFYAIFFVILLMIVGYNTLKWLGS